MRTIAIGLLVAMTIGLGVLTCGCNTSGSDEDGKTVDEIRDAGPEAGKAGMLSKGGRKADTAK